MFSGQELRPQLDEDIDFKIGEDRLFKRYFIRSSIGAYNLSMGMR